MTKSTGDYRPPNMLDDVETGGFPLDDKPSGFSRPVSARIVWVQVPDDEQGGSDKQLLTGFPFYLFAFSLGIMAILDLVVVPFCSALMLVNVLFEDAGANAATITVFVGAEALVVLVTVVSCASMWNHYTQNHYKAAALYSVGPIVAIAILAALYTIVPSVPGIN